MMVWIDIIFGSLVYLSSVAFAVLTIGTIAVRLTSQPIERIRIIQLTLLTVFAAATLGQVSIMPRWNLGLLDYTDETTLPVSHADSAMDSSDSGPMNIDAMAMSDPDFTGEHLDASEISTEKRDVIEPAVVSTTSDFWSNAAWPSLQQGARLLCVVAFALATLLFAIESLVGMLRLRQITRAATRAPAALIALWQSVSGNHGQNVRLLVSDQIETPLTFGSLRPVILFPQRMLTNSTRDEQRFCLAHEWTHVRQRDILTWHLITLSQPLLWCQPLLWHLRRELRVCQDLLADSAAAASGPEDYAELLLSLGKNNSSLPAGAALGIGDRKSNLYRRITMLLDNTINTRTRCRPGVLATAFSVCTAVAMVASFVSLDSSRAAQPDGAVSNDENNKKTRETKTVDDAKVEPLSYSGVVSGKTIDDAIHIPEAWELMATVEAMLTSGKKAALENDYELLNLVAFEHGANREAIKTWQGTVKVISDRMDGNRTRHQESDVTFAFDRDLRAKRWNWDYQVFTILEGDGEMQLDLPLTCGMIKGGAFYRLFYHSKSNKGPRTFLIDGKSRFSFGPESDDFDPMYCFTDFGNPFHERFASIYKLKKAGSAKNWSATRKGNIVSLVTDSVMPGGGKVLNHYIIDLSKGANLVLYHSTDPFSEFYITYEYEQISDAWVPRKQFYQADRFQEGTISRREASWGKNQVNYPTDESLFSLAALGASDGDRVKDTRTGTQYIIGGRAAALRRLNRQNRSN